MIFRTWREPARPRARETRSIWSTPVLSLPALAQAGVEGFRPGEIQLG